MKAAHEKILYERPMNPFQENEVYSQRISPPAIFQLSMREKNYLLEHAEHFEKLGFIIEPFGGNDFALSGVPTTLYSMQPEEYFIDLLDQLALCEGAWV